MRHVIGTLFLLFYSVFSFASIEFPTARKLYESADLVFVGALIRFENETEETRSALLKNLLTIKGEFTPEVRLCDNHAEWKKRNANRNVAPIAYEGFMVESIHHEKQVYFVRRQNGCHVGAWGNRSKIYIKKDTNCIFAEIAYAFEEGTKDKLEPLEVFVNKLVGEGVISIPESLKSGKCEPLFQDH